MKYTRNFEEFSMNKKFQKMLLFKQFFLSKFGHASSSLCMQHTSLEQLSQFRVSFSL